MNIHGSTPVSTLRSPRRPRNASHALLSLVVAFCVGCSGGNGEPLADGSAYDVSNAGRWLVILLGGVVWSVSA